MRSAALEKIITCPFATWIKRFGWAGFMFFFIKGILWLMIPSLLVWLGIEL